MQMTSTLKADRIRLLSFSSPPMRAFHMSWIGFFCCFFAWFGMAPLMAIVRREMQLTPAQVGNIIIASVAGTILARLGIGWVCDRFGPRLTYTWLLIIGALPVMSVGLARDYQSFLIFRLAIGAIGASFVVTQYHTSVMFARNCVGTANAMTAGWGNMGGGVAQLVMPLIFSLFVTLGFSEFWGWRLAMLVPGALMLVTGLCYWMFTQDGPEKGKCQSTKPRGSFVEACRDPRVWALALIYGGCFGIEITIHNVAALYFTDNFGAGLRSAGAIVGAFGMLALFARALGGFLSDRINLRFGLPGRVAFLASALLTEGTLLILFSRVTSMSLAVSMLLMFGLFVHISCGATYAVIPFINRKSVGSVAGIVGAGGNVGAVLSGFLFQGQLPWATVFLLLGVAVTISSCLALLVRFDRQQEIVEIELPQISKASVAVMG